MNKHRYRVIFNKARGCLIAVAESAVSHHKSAGSKVGKLPLPMLADALGYAATLRPMAFTLLILSGQALLIHPAHADGIVADNAAPTNQQPVILETANGIPQVNIQTPSAAGVSRNTYSQFDVGAPGAILNNSRSDVQTQLGGYVQANPYLATGTARVILNEVNSSNPSLLNGYVEVAGSRAQVVIANPAGISCNGCGFINANRATLTTGTAIFNNGNLEGYRVQRGTINIFGNGMDSRQTDYTDIIARAVQVNANLFANDLRVTTGSNQVNVASDSSVTSTTPISSTGSAPTVAIDVAQLGGMYAGKIYLIGTEAGVGVTNAGHIGASAGEVRVDVNGILTNAATARINSRQDMQINANSGITNAGTLYALGNTTLNTQGDLDNTGTIAALGNVSLTANGTASRIDSGSDSIIAAGLQADGSLSTINSMGAHINVSANQSISAHGQNLASGDQVFLADSLDISGSNTMGHDLSFNAKSGILVMADANINANDMLTAFSTNTITTDRAHVAAQQLNLHAHDLSNIGGELLQSGNGDTSLVLAGNLNNDQGRIAVNSSNLSLTANTIFSRSSNGKQSSIEHTGAGILEITSTSADANAFNGAGGLFQSSGELVIKAEQINLDESRTSGKQISVEAIKLSNKNGQILQSGAELTSIHVDDLFDNASGTLATNGNMALTVGDLANQSGWIQSADDVAIISATLNNTNGTIHSVQGDVGINVSSAALDNTLGKIMAAQQMAVTSHGVNNESGSLLANRLSIDTQFQTFNNAQGAVTSMTTLDIHTGAINNDSGLIQSGADMLVNTHGQALNNTNSGNTNGIISQGAITLSSADLINQSGYIGAKRNLIANSDNIDNKDGGVIASEADVTLHGAGLDNQAGSVQALGNISVNAVNGMIDNRNGLLKSAQVLDLKAASIDNRNTLSANHGLEGALVSSTAHDIDNSNGAIRADDAVNIAASQSLNNRSGLISSANTLGIVGFHNSANTGNNLLAITNTSGTFIAGTRLNIDSKSLTGDGQILSKGNLTTKLTTDYFNTGTWHADGSASLTSSGSITNGAKLLAGGTLSMQASAIDNRAGAEIAAETVHLIANSSGLTNRGLINGQDTWLAGSTVNNVGSGRIYGDHLAIDTAELNNTNESINGVASAAVIAARSRLDIGASAITNREHALIFSAGDMAIAADLDDNQQATGTASILNNNSASIEALGNLRLNVATINNTNDHFSMQDVLVSNQSHDEFQGQGGSARYRTPAGTALNPGIPYCGGDCFNAYNSPSPNGNVYATSVRNALYQWVIGGQQYRNAYRYIYTRNITETQLVSSDPAKILAGNSMQIVANNVLNDKSQIIAGGALNAAVGTLNNTSVSGQRITTDRGTTYLYITHDPKGGGNDYTEIQSTGYAPASSVQSIQLAPSLFLQNTSINMSGTTVASLTGDNINQAIAGTSTTQLAIAHAQSVPSIVQIVAANQNGGGSANVIRTVIPDINLPSSSLFQANPNSTQHYLIETDPHFADYRSWLSSDYLLQQMNVDPTTTQKRLGDGFYEQKLVREQIAQLTGRRFLDGYANDEAQYQALMSNAATVAQAWQLVPGIALSAEQVAQLTSDIVWLVEQTFTLADGSTLQALVPQVYVRVKAGDLDGSGALISADSTHIALSGDLTNQHGSIAGRTLLSLDADNLNNIGGRLTAADVNLNASRDLNNLGGQVDAINRLLATAGKDINITSTTSTQSNASGSRTNIDRVAGLYVTGNQGLLVASAGQDLNLLGATLSNNASANLTDIAASTGSQTQLQAGRNVNLGTVTSHEQGLLTWNPHNTLQQTSSQQQGSLLQTTGDLTINAGQDLIANAATISSSQGNLTASAGNSITIGTGLSTTTSQGHTSYGYGTTNSTAVVTTHSTSSLAAGNNLTLQSGADSHLTSVSLTAGDTLSINTTGNLTLDAAKNNSQLDYAYRAKNKRDIIQTNDDAVVGSQLTAGNNITLNATQSSNSNTAAGNSGNLTLNSTDISSQNGAVSFNAANTISIGSTDETHERYEEHYTKNRSLLSSKSTLTIDQASSSYAIGSTVSGDTVSVNAARDLAVIGSNVVSTNGTILNAGGNITIQAAQNTAEESHFNETKKSGFMSSGGLGFSVGKQQLTNTGTSQTTTHTASTVGSTDGDVTINAGKAYTQTGSDVLAPQGDIAITAQSVDINAAQNTSVNTQQTKFKQTGITVSVSNPVISAVQTASQMANAASQTSDGRMQALAAGTSALAAKNAYDAVNKGMAVTDGNLATKAGGIDVSISFGTSKSQSDSTQTSSVAQGSNVTAGRDINITATGAGTASNLNVIGSTITAADDVTLKADNQINLLAAQNTDTLTSSNKSSSASVGASFGLGADSSGLSLNASMSKGKGSANGTDTTWTETIVQGGNHAGDKTTLESGTDTNLIGAQVKGNRVIADVGTSGAGNLNIQSLQDTSSYDSQQKSAGVSVSVPIGPGTAGGSISAFSSKMTSDYASVNEQAGILAGDDRFQAKVANNTNLTGGVMASTQTAIDHNANSLTTQTLTFSDIQNQAEYQANAMSATIGGGIQAGMPVLSGAGTGKDEGKASSVTVSSISAGSVNISESTSQKILTGQDAVTTVALLNRDVKVDENGNAVDSNGNSTAATIAPIFDAEKVEREIQAQVQITQTFSEQAPKVLSTFIIEKTRPYQDAKDYQAIKAKQEQKIPLSAYEQTTLKKP